MAELAARLGATVHGDGGLRVDHVAPLESAGVGAISFFANPRYRSQFRATGAAAVIVAADAVADCPVTAIVSDNPYHSYALAARALNPEPAVTPSIDPTAVVHPEALIGADVSIGPNAVIEAGARLGDRVRLGAGCFVGAGSSIGADTWLGPNATVMHGVAVGRRCQIYPGAVLGADGFGFARGKQGWTKVPQLGGLRIGDDCDIGANAAIDRGALTDTVIEDDVKIDNLVQIGHNVRVGRHTAIAGCVGVAGSTSIGENCLIGGAAGLAGHIDIAAGVTLMGKSAVTGSISEPGAYASLTPLAPVRLWRKNAVRINHLDEMYRRLKALEKELAALKDQSENE